MIDHLPAIPGFTLAPHSHLGETRAVYRRGHGPAVIVMSEIPGITPQVTTFATTVADAGFSVWMPQLFGTPLQPITVPYLTRSVLRICISKEFSTLAANQSSPIVDWLRALAREAHEACGGPGVGAVGMCLTGNFGLAMMLDAPVIAPVLSQPSLPIPVPGRRDALHVSPKELAAAHDKIDKHGARILGLRFHGDPLCAPSRFERLRREFGDAFEGIEIDACHGNREGFGNPHSVLTTHLIDEAGQPTRAALDRTLAFLREQLVK
ncbi:dienelactone hydrolase family protein [uncultured Nevskia sp.]|uniref:dienelactone hydrolase family protein n=1 Tax=uncultured Nevskia sp. TaxID=228950 RepID=UPI0025E42699|nr:dienelactone hydrolase family protein [uncultured Nevskia sp.]